MKFTEFKNRLSDGEERSIYLFEGEDAYFGARGLTLLKEKFVTEPQLNFASFDNVKDVEELAASLFGLPFMSKKRLTAVREFYPDKKDIKGKLKTYLENPPPESILAIINSSNCENLKKFDSVTVVDCGKSDVQLLVRWIKAEAAKSNVYIDGESAKLVAEYCLSDMTRIENETHKLIDYAGEGGAVSAADVNNLVAKDAEYKIYEMTDYIAKRKADKALTVLKDMLYKGEPPQKLLVSIYNYFRKLLMVSISDMSKEELCKALNMKEYAMQKTMSQAAQFKPRSLKNAVDMLADADYGIKSGVLSADGKLFSVVFKIMTEE